MLQLLKHTLEVGIYPSSEDVHNLESLSSVPDLSFLPPTQKAWSEPGDGSESVGRTYLCLPVCLCAFFLVHTPSGCPDWGWAWARVKPRAKNSICVSNEGGRDPSTSFNFCSPLRYIIRELDQSRAIETLNRGS